MFGISILPEAASSGAAAVDVLFWGLVALSLGFAVPIGAIILFFSVKYRNGREANRQQPPRTNRLLEVVWTVIPIFIGAGFFVWASVIYVGNSRPPANSLEIYVVGKQWMWKIQHQNGRREINALHVPLGQPIKLTMTSQDVIHDFFVPAFRVKQDVLPGRYTHEWFTPTKVGVFPSVLRAVLRHLSLENGRLGHRDETARLRPVAGERQRATGDGNAWQTIVHATRM